jgi:hypothetical protein
VKSKKRYGLPRQPYLDPDDQPGIKASLLASDQSAAAKKLAEKVFTNLNRRFVHLEAWIRVSLNEILKHFKSEGTEEGTVAKAMMTIRLALRQYRQAALLETQIALGVVDPPTREVHDEAAMLSVTTLVAQEKQHQDGARALKQLNDGPPSKRFKTADDNGGSTRGGGKSTDSAPASGDRASRAPHSHRNAGGNRAATDGDALAKND